MATVVAPSSDQAAELMQKLSLESQSKTLEAPEATKKSAAFKRGSTDSKESNGTTLPSDRSTTAANPEFADPNMCYLPNGYASAYYYGGYDGSVDWDEYSRYLNADATGVYGDNSSLLYHGYGYSPYGPYSPATSPVPSMGHDGLYGPQQYQYPAYYQNPTTPNEPYNATKGPAKQAELSTSTASDKPALSVEVPNGSSKGSVDGASNGSLPLRPSQQNSSLNSNASYGRGTVTGGLPSSGYVDPRYNFDGLKSPLPWYDTTSYTDTKDRSGTNYSSVSHANSIQAGRNQSLRPFSNLMGLQSPGHTTGIGATPGYMNRYYPNNRMYGQYGSNYRTGSGYGSTGYDSRTYGRGWLTFDGKYKTKGRGNGFYGYGNENMDGLNELNRGPRARGVKTQKVATSVTLAVKGQDIPTDTDTENKDTSSANADREQYNRENFPVKYTDAKFYVIKSYSEDDVHKSIKYNVWASTPNGNKKLADGYQQAQEKAGGCPVFLMFSVNTSGQFVGLAEMIGPVDFDKTVEYWQQDKWNGCFPLKWHIVKDIPNSLLKHITLENNDNKPVTNSRDTQEVKLEQGLQVLKIFKEHTSKTCILDDFEFYEGRQKTVQEKKAKQQQYQKQVWEGKNNEVTVSDEKEKEVSSPKEGGATNGDIKSNGNVKSNGDIKANGDVKQCEDGEVVVASKETPPKGGAKSVVTENGHLSNGVAVANGGC